MIEINLAPKLYIKVEEGTYKFLISDSLVGIAEDELVRIREYVCGEYTSRELLKGVERVITDKEMVGLKEGYSIICLR